MQNEFIELWNKINAKGDPIAEFSRLSQLYSNPERFYHNLNHIKNCLNELNQIENLMKNPNLIRFAIWYHDAIYNTKLKDNEEQSAELAHKVCLAAKLSNKFAIDTKNAILSTKHNIIPNSFDLKSLIDIDLSILGKSPEEYNQYELNILKEYAWAPIDKYKNARKQVLQMFLNRDSIYLTDFFRNKYETQARLNLQKAIENL